VLTAMIAALIAPIEIFATQSGKYSEDRRRQCLINSRLIAAKRTSALHNPTNLFVIMWRTPSRISIGHRGLSLKYKYGTDSIS
jgi:hypothetical protein